MSSNEKRSEPVLKEGDKVTREYANGLGILCSFNRRFGIVEYRFLEPYVYALSPSTDGAWTCVSVRLDSYAQYGEEINMLKNRK